MHVMAERAVLVRLMLMAALGARGLHDGSDRHVETLHDKAEARAMLLRLCTSLVKYNLSMSSDECGGRSTFRVFFKTLRKVGASLTCVEVEWSGCLIRLCCRFMAWSRCAWSCAKG